MLTVAEYRAAPTAVDSNNLVQGGNAAAQDAALLNKIRSAQAWVESVINQPITASAHVEFISVYIGQDGLLNIHPANGPINQVTAVSLGATAATLATVSDLTGGWISRGQYLLPVSTYTGRNLAKLTYVSAWPQTTLKTASGANATQLIVNDPTGFLPTQGSDVGTQITIYDGAATEQVTVTAVAGAALTVTACVNAHQVGASISSMPADLKEIAVNVTSALIRAGRSSEALVMTSNTVPGAPQGTDPTAASMLRMAKNMLIGNYDRVR